MSISRAITGIDKSGSYRVYMGISTDMVQKAHELHHTSPLATHLLGRALTGTGLMGIMLREPNFKVTLQFKGSGMAQQVLCTADSAGNVKGYIANPVADLPPRTDGKPDVGGALGKGVLTCIRDTGTGEPYVGRVDLVSGEIADDMAQYFFTSEQQRTLVSLGVKLDEKADVKASAGLIVQLLPDADEGAVSALESWMSAMAQISEIADQVSEASAGSAEERILEEFMITTFFGMPAEYMPEAMDFPHLGWRCDCSEERLEQVVMSLGSKEVRKIIEEDGQAEITCQFCGKAYYFDKAHLERIEKRLSGGNRLKEM